MPIEVSELAAAVDTVAQLPDALASILDEPAAEEPAAGAAAEEPAASAAAEEPAAGAAAEEPAFNDVAFIRQAMEHRAGNAGTSRALTLLQNQVGVSE